MIVWPSPNQSRGVRIPGALLAVAFLAFVLHTATAIGGKSLFETWV